MDTTSLVKEQVKQGAQGAVNQTQQTAGRLGEQVKNQATTMLESQKGKATESLSSFAQALRQTSESLQTQNQAPISGALNQAAQRVDGVSTYLQQSDVTQLWREAENFARRKSAWFLGGAFALGMAASRFIKSTAPSSGSTGGSGYGTGYDASGYGSGFGGVTEQGAYNYAQPSYNYGAGDLTDTQDISSELAYTDEVADTGGESTQGSSHGTASRSR
jgi:hypothetical protein